MLHGGALVLDYLKKLDPHFQTGISFFSFFFVFKSGRNITISDYKKAETKMFFRSSHGVPLSIYFISHNLFVFGQIGHLRISLSQYYTQDGSSMSGLGFFHWPAVCRGYNLAPQRQISR